jgi:hypothetical protein
MYFMYRDDFSVISQSELGKMICQSKLCLMRVSLATYTIWDRCYKWHLLCSKCLQYHDGNRLNFVFQFKWGVISSLAVLQILHKI